MHGSSLSRLWQRMYAPRRAVKRMEAAQQTSRFWEKQFDLLYARCAPYGVIGRIAPPQSPKEQALRDFDAFCQSAVRLAEHWDDALMAGYPLRKEFAAWVQDVVLPWHHKVHR